MSAPGGPRPDDDGHYPQEPFYGPGWSAPVAPAPTRRRSRRPLVALLVTLVMVGAVAATTVVVRTWADQRPLGEVSGTVSAHPRQLATGHCLPGLPSDGTVERVTVAPCAEPHEAEVIAVHVLDDGPWPGRSRVEAEASAACEMDTAQREAGARPVVWTPGPDAWDQGERRALCLAWVEGGAVTGSWTAGDATPG